MTARQIINTAGLLLADTAFERWPQDTLQAYLNEGRRQVTLIRPDASAEVRTVKLDAGSRQTLPDDCRLLLKVLHNAGSDGQSVGEVVRYADEAVLNASEPARHVPGTTTAVEEYTYDLRLPGTYFVFPAVPAGADIYITIAASTELSDITLDEPIGLDDVYSGPLLDWTLYRAFHADTESQASRARAAAHYDAFHRALGEKTNSDVAASPLSEVQS